MAVSCKNGVNIRVSRKRGNFFNRVVGLYKIRTHKFHGNVIGGNNASIMDTGLRKF